MGISADRAYRIQEKMKARMADAYGAAISFRSTDETLFRSTQAVYNSPEMAKAPYRVRAYLQGYEQALRDNLWNKQLVWMLWLDDRLVDSSDVDAATTREQVSGESKRE